MPKEIATSGASLAVTVGRCASNFRLRFIRLGNRESDPT